MARCGVPGCPLSRAELRALRDMSEGLSAKQSAALHRRSLYTIHGQRRAARRKLGVRTDAEALSQCKPSWLKQGTTWAQRLYLEAFDLHLRAWASGNEALEQRTRKLMDAIIPAAFGEIPRRGAARCLPDGPLERMAHTMISMSDETGDLHGQGQAQQEEG